MSALRFRRRLAGVLAAVLGSGGVECALNERGFEETDDAQVDGEISSVSPRIAGSVIAVHAVQNQTVTTGDVLAELDPADLEIAVDEAKAEVAEARAQLEAEDPSVHITTTSDRSAASGARSDFTAGLAALEAARREVDRIGAQLAQAEANDRTAQLERSRSEKLVATGSVSPSEYDTRASAADVTAAGAEALRHALAAAKSRVEEQRAAIVAAGSRLAEVQANAPRHLTTRKAWVVWRRASVDYAEARLAQARKNLSYARIVAPVSGVVASKSASVGDYVAPGGELFAIAQSDSLWVTANYSETQIAHMKPGQPVTIHVDAVDADLRGAVETIGGATGGRLSMLPPENTSANYVKIVQRVPVRIRFAPDSPGLERFRIGMSVEPKVRVK